MLKDVFSNRLLIGALAFFVLCVGGSLFYSHHEKQKGEAELAETKDHVAQWNERQNPTTEVKAGDTSQGGRVHADGTWHEGPHETPEQPTRQAPQLQEYAQYIPAHLLEAQSLAYVDMARSKAAFRAALPKDPFSAEFEKAVKSAVQQAVALHPGIYDLPPGHLRRVQSAIAHNLMIAAFDEAMGLQARYDDPSSVARAKEILSWTEPYDALFTNTTQHEEEKNR